jgi:hypothetical protein
MLSVKERTLLTVPQAAPETCGRRFRRGQETHAEQWKFERERDEPLVSSL